MPGRGDTSRRVIIVGGGVSGLSVAQRLAEAGLPVTLLETSRLGFEASSRNQGWLHSGGLLAPRHTELARLCLESMQQTVELFPECLEPDISGMLYFAADSSTDLEPWARAWDTAGIPFEAVAGRTLKQRIPMACLPPDSHGFLLPDQAIRPDMLLRGLARGAEDAGAELRPETPIRKLIFGDERMKGVVTAAGEEIFGRFFIFATGASSEFWPQINGHGAGCQPQYARVRLRSNLMAVRPGLCSWPFCVVDREGLSHIPHQEASVFGIDRWDVVADGKHTEVDESEYEVLRHTVQAVTPLDETQEASVWSATTVQAMHMDQIQPGRVPLPTVIDHGHSSVHRSNVLSVFPGRMSLWVHVAREAERLTLERIEDDGSQVATSGWTETEPESETTDELGAESDRPPT